MSMIAMNMATTKTTLTVTLGFIRRAGMVPPIVEPSLMPGLVSWHHMVLVTSARKVTGRLNHCPFGSKEFLY